MEQKHQNKKYQDFNQKPQEHANLHIKFQQNMVNPDLSHIQENEQLRKEESQIQGQQSLNQSENQYSQNIEVKEQEKSDKTSSPFQKQTGIKDKRYLNRSSNNSHKKYAATAKKNLFKYLSQSRKNKILEMYKSHRSSRIYYFCLLLHARIDLQGKQFRKFVRGFVKDIKEKIIKYTQEIFKTKNEKLINFRTQEIEDLKISLVSFKIFFTSTLEKGIQCLYKKTKKQIMKLPQYQRCVLILKDLEKKFQKKTYNFEIQKVIDSELQKKVRQYRVTLPEAPQFIQLQKPTRRNQNNSQLQIQKGEGMYRMTRRQQLSLKKQVQVEIQKQEPLKEVKKDDIMNKKTRQQDQEESQQKAELISISQNKNPFVFGSFQSVNPTFPPPFGFPSNMNMNTERFSYINFGPINQLNYHGNNLPRSSFNQSTPNNANLMPFPFMPPGAPFFQQQFGNQLTQNFPPNYPSPFSTPFQNFNPQNSEKKQK